LVQVSRVFAIWTAIDGRVQLETDLVKSAGVVNDERSEGLGLGSIAEPVGQSVFQQSGGSRIQPVRCQAKHSSDIFDSDYEGARKRVGRNQVSARGQGDHVQILRRTFDHAGHQQAAATDGEQLVCFAAVLKEDAKGFERSLEVVPAHFENDTRFIQENIFLDSRKYISQNGRTQLAQ
jgi:hypothetical protein